MSSYAAEIAFFHTIAPKVIDLVATSSDRSIAEQKSLGDFSTVLDIASEQLIVTAIQDQFPEDAVLAEEGYSDTAIPNSRLWIIDPICGTNNLGKGINTFCSNIALVDNGQIVAACVIDHMEKTYVWSAGDLPIYIADKECVLGEMTHGVKVDIDFGSVRSVDNDFRVRHNAALLNLINNTEYDVISLNSSLGFMYVSIGKVDGFICIYNHPWDIAPASYFLQKQGGIITDPNGEPWTISSVGAVGARSIEIHQTLLNSLHP